MARWLFQMLFILEVAAITFFITSMGMLPFAVFASCPAGRPVCPQAAIGDVVTVLVFFLFLPELAFLSKRFKATHPVIFQSFAIICLIWTAAFFVLL